MFWSSSNKPMTVGYICESIFPFQAALGIGGNILTLVVLLSRPMRSRTNIFLALAATCDIMLLLCMIPNNLSRRRDWIYEDCEPGRNGTRCWTPFFYFYVHTKSNFTFLLNLFSGASTWFMVAVSFDRLWAIKSPLTIRASSKRHRLLTAPVIVGIFLMNAATTLYMNFSFSVTVTAQDNKTMKATQSNQVMFIFALINVAFQIFIPMILLIVFNGFLIHYLRSRRQFLASATLTTDRKSSDETPPLLENQRKITTVSRNGSNCGLGWGRQLGKAERHVTLTVALIVSAYVITHMPSAVLYTILYMFNASSIGSEKWYTAISLSTSIVIMGKIANFFLFCMSSRYFRAQMASKLCCSYRLCYRDRNDPKTRSLPLNQIGDSNSNVPNGA